eukprot:CAMPEP_0197549512 /NCGR_PEP_ID=MMETSP1320-20131121/3395_1 /TAXON_ID=91990 /ORGANISM="Bolidomonas sp., Strain RCC2347" /LENGTH=195 /DNA_ID=CAMNT_0043109755 /DNA_START=80 /DNA_END=667 /DNA_ORIENTATION=-
MSSFEGYKQFNEAGNSNTSGGMNDTTLLQNVPSTDGRLEGGIERPSIASLSRLSLHDAVSYQPPTSLLPPASSYEKSSAAIELTAFSNPDPAAQMKSSCQQQQQQQQQQQEQQQQEQQQQERSDAHHPRSTAVAGSGAGDFSVLAHPSNGYAMMSNTESDYAIALAMQMREREAQREEEAKKRTVSSSSWSSMRR